MTFEEQVDQLLGEFDQWFQAQQNEPLVHTERAILKTAFWYLKNVREINPIPEKPCEK